MKKKLCSLFYFSEVTRAECVWAMATSQLGFSYNSSQFLPEIFRSMFPDSSIAADYSLRPRKLSYIISHGTGYYFTNELIKDVRKVHGFHYFSMKLLLLVHVNNLIFFFDIGLK